MALISGSSLQSTTAAAAQSKSWTLLNTYTVSSGVLSVDIDDFSSEYDDYVIYVDRISASVLSQDLCMRVNDITATEYSYTINGTGSATYDSRYSAGSSEWRLSLITPDLPDSNNNNYSSYIIELNNTNDSTTKPHFLIRGTALYSNATYLSFGGGNLKTPAVAINKINFFMETGATINTGQFKIFGIKG